MSDDILRADVKLNEQGRVVVPAALRSALGLQPGDDLVLYVDDGGLRIDSMRNLVRRMQAQYAALPAHGDLIQELTDLRRDESRQFDEEHPRAPGQQSTTRRARSA